MATATTSERKAPARRRAPKAEHLSMAYPDLPPASHPHYWVSTYLIYLAERIALEHLRLRMREKLDPVTLAATYASDYFFCREINDRLEYARDHGLLLYAWPGTKLFTNPEARH